MVQNMEIQSMEKLLQQSFSFHPIPVVHFPFPTAIPPSPITRVTKIADKDINEYKVF